MYTSLMYKIYILLLTKDKIFANCQSQPETNYNKPGYRVSTSAGNVFSTLFERSLKQDITLAKSRFYFLNFYHYT